MGNAFGSGNNEKNKRKLSETRDDDEDEHDPLWDLPDAVQDIVLGEVELSTEQLKAAGHYLWEVQNAGRDYTSIAVLALPGVVAKQPPSTLDYDESQLDVIHAAGFQEWGGCPPDHATIRAMGAVGRRALVRFFSREWRGHGQKGYNGNNSLKAFQEFKEMAFKLNDGKKPNEAFFLKHFKVHRGTFMNFTRDRRLWYFQLNMCRRSRTDKWVKTNKQWLEEHGVFSAWEKHCEALGGEPRRGGWVGEVKYHGDVNGITKDLNARLQGEEFVYPDDDKWYRVLVVRWIADWKSHAVLCHEAALADPTANQKSKIYIARMQDECFPASVEDVDDWIKRSPKRARIE